MATGRALGAAQLLSARLFPHAPYVRAATREERHAALLCHVLSAISSRPLTLTDQELQATTGVPCTDSWIRPMHRAMPLWLSSNAAVRPGKMKRKTPRRLILNGRPVGHGATTRRETTRPHVNFGLHPLSMALRGVGRVPGHGTPFLGGLGRCERTQERKDVGDPWRSESGGAC